MTASLDAILEDDPMNAPVCTQGARGSVHRDDVITAIQDATKQHDAVIQAFRPDAIYGHAHLEAAARRALRSHHQERAIARDVAVEIALYAAGTTQIEDALELVGLPVEGEGVLFAAVGPEREPAVGDILAALNLEPAPDLVDEQESALDRLGIKTDHRERVDTDQLGLLVQEHVALLDTRS